VVVTAARGSADAVATASAGATTGGLIAAESRAGAGVGVETGAGAEVGVDVETDGDVDFDADADAGAEIGAEGAVVVGRAAISLGGAATLAALAFPLPAFAQAAARVVVIGGGFGGASCARALKAIEGLP